MLGAGASLLGLIIYSTFTIVTGWTIGYLALAVGWLVAKAMMKASNGVGGRRYQVAAVLLTYAAISVSAVPIGIASYIKHRSEKTQQTTTQTAQDSNASQDGQDGAAQTKDGAKESNSGLLSAIGLLLFYGLASPFLELANPGSGILGLIILSVGLSIAYRSTAAKPLDVDGPFSNA